MRGETNSEFPARAAAAVLGDFMRGQSLSVSQKRRPRWRLRKAEQPQLERLEDVDEVWAICLRKPGAGWRLVGRFLECDALVVFRVADKRDIGIDYGPISSDIQKDWEKYFGTQQPCTGGWIHGYVSGVHYDVDEKKQIGGE
jgi:hypothetical protein